MFRGLIQPKGSLHTYGGLEFCHGGLSARLSLTPSDHSSSPAVHTPCCSPTIASISQQQGWRTGLTASLCSSSLCVALPRTAQTPSVPVGPQLPK